LFGVSGPCPMSHLLVELCQPSPIYPAAMSPGGAIEGVVRERLGARSALRPRRLPLLPWSRFAWAAIGLTAGFIALTVWWLTQNRAMPSDDAVQELLLSIQDRDWLLHGHAMRVLEFASFYPPYGHLLAAVSAMIGGVGVTAPVIGENVVYVTLLALACYRVGRLVSGAREGALAVAFALGSPLIIEQSHVFMLDLPLAALVATCIWLVLESDRFARLRIAALSGFVAGIGMGTKEQFPIYIVGLLAVVLARGRGWRNIRGIALFASIAIAVASPWYVRQHDLWSTLLDAAGTGSGLKYPVPPLARPARLSAADLEWYGWATLNGLLFAPLSLFAMIGIADAVASWRARRSAQKGVPELLGGLLGSWLVLTVMTHKDMRYTEPMILYLAVFGTTWIGRLRPSRRRAAVAALAAAVIATTTGATFGVGGPIPTQLPGNRRHAPRGEGVPPLGGMIVYANHDWLVSRPRGDGGLSALLQALRRRGVHAIAWIPEQAPVDDRNFNDMGLQVFVLANGLSIADDPAHLRAGEARLLHGPVDSAGSTPCLRFDDGSGVWVVEGPDAHPRAVCPMRRAG
jgi:Dolichyl-phosphate-mannose-protein mannosyltransferase